MRDKLIQLLIQNLDTYISGEDISKVYGVTRAAIWKHIQLLKAQGCDIVCTPHRGYKLRSMPDSMRPEFIMAWLSTKYIGKEIRYFEKIDSTNNKARELAASGCAQGLIVLADEQDIGKGRMGRRWYSPVGVGIYFSVVLRPELHPSQAPQITVAAAVAAVRAIRVLTGIDAQNKWPNDIVADDKKIAGIMTEMSADMDRINWMVVGIGVNVNNTWFPPEIAEHATSLKNITGANFSRVQLLLTICHELEDILDVLIKKGNFQEILEEYESYSAIIAKRVRITRKDSSTEGTVEGFDRDGALLLKLDNGEIERIVSGDVSLRGMNEYV
ncbi:MAG: biotin--[acetyl-CoA-carboxylase] ligase [Bacillota bacterium]|nr:biotin--[acetyl-CoA-carboxylase] ligase [Bacillota bacterium]